MATISNTPRPGYVWDATDNVWYPIGVGGHSHSEIAKTIADAKGDLIVGTAADTVDRLAVGNNGETLVADSAASTGLRYSATPSASNPIINSAFQVWQRGTANVTTASAYTADRWMKGGFTHFGVSRQVTGDTTNLPNIQYCARVQRTAASTDTTGMGFGQSIESINSIPFAGKTVTFSFYARAGANYSAASNSLSATLYSGTGTDQNILVSFTGLTAVASPTTILTTTWQRFTATGTVSSTATELGLYFQQTPTGTAGANDYYELTGVQIDIGSVALPFRTYAATIQGELAACQRYYYRFAATSTNQYFGAAYARSTTNAFAIVKQPVTMRTAPSLSFASGSTYFRFQLGSGDFDVTTLDGTYYATTDTALVRMSSSGMTTGNGGMAQFNNASAYIEMSSEL